MPTVTAHNDQHDQADSLPAIFGQFSRPLTPVQAEQITMAILDAEWTWDQAITAGQVVGTVTRGFRLKIGAMLWQTMVEDGQVAYNAAMDRCAEAWDRSSNTLREWRRMAQDEFNLPVPSIRSAAATERPSTVKRRGATSSQSVVVPEAGTTVEREAGEDGPVAAPDSQSTAGAKPPAQVLRRRASRVLARRKPANKAGARRLVAATPKSVKARRDNFTPLSPERVGADRAAVEAKLAVAKSAEDRDALAPIPDGPDWWMPIEVIEHIAAEATRIGKRPGALLEEFCYMPEDPPS